MKCQRCEKPATYHITELTSGKPQELHLCEEHAREYLTPTGAEPASITNLATQIAHHMAQQMEIGQTAEELQRLDQQVCPICGISFQEFRSQGRLGCSNDYAAFHEQLDPLLFNIHGGNEHVGKTPRRAPEGGEHKTQLIRLRREMQEAIVGEDYERASALRDQIRTIESGHAP